MKKQNFKPIFFSTEMVQAILDGRKTQTRRIIENQENTEYIKPIRPEFPEYGRFYTNRDSLLKPKYQPGDILWVRETWQCVDFKQEFNNELTDIVYKICYTYKASNDLRPDGVSVEDHHGNWVTTDEKRHDYQFYKAEEEENEGRDVWYPSIHMPREAARIFLEVNDFRAERLNDISEEDAISEGIRSFTDEDKQYFYCYPVKEKGMTRTVSGLASLCDTYISKGIFGIENPAAFSFETLWESIHGKNSWKKNPWVWVYTFKRIEKPENF